MAITRINNNQITDAIAGNLYVGINAAAKLQNYSITSQKISNNLTYGSDLTIAGNLTVQGNVTAIDTIDLVVEDPLILLAKDQTGAPTLDIGFIGERGTDINIAFIWDEGAGEFATVFTNDAITNTVVTIDSYASLHVANITASNADITGNVTFSGNIVGNLSVSGNVNGGNLNSNAAVTGVTIAASGNLEGNNATITNGVSSATVTASGNILGGNVNSNAAVTGVTVTASGNLEGNNATITNAVSTATLNASGNIIGGNVNSNAAVTGVTVTASGNLEGNNATITNGVSTATLDASGNVVAGNLNANTNVTGVTITASGNLEGGNAVVTGDVSAATVNAVTVTASGNLVGGNANITAGVFAATITASGNVNGGNINTNSIVGTDITVTGANVNFVLTGNVDMGQRWINDLADPIQAFDAATKQYVDDAVSAGLTIHTPVYVESPTALTATYAQGGTVLTVTDTVAGNTVVFGTAANLQPNDQLWFSTSFEGIVGNVGYFVVSAPNTSAAVLSTTFDGVPVSNITGNTGLSQSVRVNSGIGATLTNSAANAVLVIDGITVTGGERVLVYTQASAAQNGVYTVTVPGDAGNAWVLTRSTDTNTYGPKSTTQLDAGDYFFVQAGDTGSGESYVLTAPTGVIIIGYSPLTFTQFSASSTYSAGNGLSLTGTIFSVNVDNVTTAIVADQVVVKASANLTTPNIGDATGNSLTLSGNGLLSTTTVSVTGNVLVTGNVSGAGAVFSGNVTAQNFIGNISGNIDAGGANTNIQFNDDNILNGSAAFTFDKTSNLVTVSGNLSAGNVNTNQLSLSGNVISPLNVTGNITGGNLITAGNVYAPAIVNNGTYNTKIELGAASGIIAVTTDGNSTQFGPSGAITLGGASQVIGGTFGGSGITLGTSQTDIFQNRDGNVTIQVGTGGATTSTWTFANSGNLLAPGNIIATGNVVGGNIATAGQASLGNIVISDDNITGTNGQVLVNSAGDDVNFIVSGDTVANLLVVDAGSDTVLIGTGTPTTNAALKIGTTNSILIPVGNTAQRPGTPVTGMVRFNTSLDVLEFYDSDSWTAASSDFTVITADEFNGDGSTVVFTLAANSTTAGTVVAINGVVQIPTTAYSVSGTTLTFTEAPETNDVIDARIFTTTTSVTSITNSGATAVVETLSTADVEITGNLIPAANTTYDLGSTTRFWNDLYLAGNTIYLGTLQLKDNGSNTFAVYTSDGVTEANIAVGNIDVTSIQSGTSTIGIAAPNGNGFITVGGNSTLVVTSTGANIAGTLNATGNITGSYILGNGSQLTGIAGGGGSSIANGTSNVSVAASGNVTVGVAGTAAVTTFATTGIFVPGLANVTGNVQGGNLRTAGQISATGAIRGASVVGGVITGSSTSVTGTTTAASVVGGVITGTSTSVTGTTTADSIVGGVITGSSTSVTGTTTAASVVGGVITGSSISVTGNVTGGNVLTVGIISSTGNILGPNLILGSGTGGNISNVDVITANTISLGAGSGGNISNVDVITANTISLGAGSGGNISNVNVITANAITLGSGTGGNISNANIITANTIVLGSGTGGNISNANIITANVITANAIVLPSGVGYMQTSVYANTTARDAAIASPAAGMIVFVTAGPNFYGYDGSTWVSLN
jgi:hypothetical protein